MVRESEGSGIMFLWLLHQLLTTKVVVKNGKKQRLYKITYKGYETKKFLGIKRRKNVWKTRWVDYDTYYKHKHPPLVSQPWEARFFR